MTPATPPLAELRRAAGLTQMQLAIAAGTTPSQISNWERGEALPGTRFLRPMAEALGVTVDTLLASVEASRRETA